MCASVRTSVCTVRVRVWVRIYVGGWVEGRGRVWVGRSRASLPKSRHEPQHTAQLLYIPNGCQGMTPLHGLCGSGVADCVQLLVQRRADTAIQDHRGRGVLQLAQQSQGLSQMLAVWLQGFLPADKLPITNGKGRPPEEKQRGRFSYHFRGVTGPNHRKGDGVKGNTPQDWYSRKGGSQGEPLRWDGQRYVKVPVAAT